MKKFAKIFLMLVMLVGLTSASVSAQDRFFLNPVELEPGTQDTLLLMLDNPDTPFYGFSVDVTLPKGLEFVKKADGKADVWLNADRLGDTYQLVTNIKNGKLLMGTFSADPEQSIQGTSGAVLYILVDVAPDFKPSSLTLSNIKLINADDRDVPIQQNSSLIGVLPTSISINPRGLGFQMIDGVPEEETLEVTFTPEYTTNRTLTWTSSDNSVATVDADGKVTAVYKGVATITATTVNGKSASCYVSIGIPVTSVEMDPTSASIQVRDALTIKATPMPLDADNREFVQWYSSDETVATVDDEGNVTPLKVGEVTITAQCGSASGTCTVTVVPTPAESVILTPDSTKLMVGESATITAEVLPDDTTDKTLTWTSSDPSIATVDENGTVTGVALGETTVTATCGTASGTCTVMVIPTPADSIILSAESAEMRVGESVTLTAEVLPDDTTDKTVTWTSSDPSIATVDADGVVTGVAVGEITVTATCGEASAICRVKVNPVLPESIDIEDSAEMYVGETLTLTAIVLPDNTTDKTVTWTSTDASIASVDEYGVVTAFALGQVKIIAACGDVSDTCLVTVVPTPVASIAVDPKTAELMVGKTIALTTVVLPELATDKTVTWTSTDASIATVDESGVVTAVALGEAKIIATSGEVSDTCVVTVIPTPAEKVILNEETIELKVGDTFTLEETVLPEDTTDKSVVWKSNDETIATVSDSGVVTAVALGEVVVSATCGNVSGICVVKVVPTPAESVTLNEENVELHVGETFTLIETVLPDDTTDKRVTWTSSDEEIATVDSNGNITAIALGKATVTATCGEVFAVCNVTVVPIPVTSVSLTNYTLLMEVGNVSELAALVQPSNATDPSVVWSSENEGIATVDQDGTVTAIAPGVTIVRVASVSNPEAVAECEVTVVKGVVPVTNILLNEYNLEMIEGETFDLIATILPEDADDQNVTWETSDVAIATVSDNGVVTAVKAGNAVIYASTSNGLTAECNVTVKAPVILPVTLTLTNTELTIREGEFAELTAIVGPEDATDKSVTWTSSNENAATVDAFGIVAGIKAGFTIVTASTHNGVTATCAVTVIPAITPVRGISLNKKAIDLTVGEEFTLIATITPEDATDKSVTWLSSEPSFATVSETGLVTAVTPGEALVLASSSNGLTDTCVVTVHPGIVEVTSITLSNTELLMKVGRTAELTEIVKPEDATDKRVTWESLNPAIATVDNGIVTSVAVGTTIIKVTSVSNPAVSAICTVVVEEDIVSVTGISLDRKTLELTVGDLHTLIATITPDDATDKSVTWKSSAPSIATVSQSGEVTAISPGEALIFASASNGLTDTCVVTVVPGIIEVTGISLSNTELLMREGHTAELTAFIYPADATDPSVTWATDRESVATVDQAGIVTAVKQGIARISATSSNGLTAICVVTVIPDIVAVEGITLNEHELELTEGDDYTLVATITPEDATDQTVTWLSSNPAVASVSDQGLVKAISAGAATIYASSSNGLTDICEVTVNPLVIEVTGISVEPTELSLWPGESATLTAFITPDDATDKSVTWISNNPEIAIVEDGVVTGLKPGTASVTAKSANGKTAICAVTVKERPLTPRQLLRKGDGTSCTFVIMMDLPDAQLTELGYNYVVGYTDANGQSTIIADTKLRYCHTTYEIYNNKNYDFWAFTYVVNPSGDVAHSNLRHLDGSEEVCFDPSKYGFNKNTLVSDFSSDDWIKVTPIGLIVSGIGEEDTQLAVYTVSGIRVFTKSYGSDALATDVIDLDRFVSGTYVVVATCGKKLKSKKIVLP